MPTVAFYVIAHQDDWELFRGQQAYEDITTYDTRIVFIYTTAGDAGKTVDWWQKREHGALRAQACGINRNSQPNNYFLKTDDLSMNGHMIRRFQQSRLPEGNPLQVASYHMRLPDGDKDGSGTDLHSHESLENLRLYGKPITSIADAKTPGEPNAPIATYTSWDDFSWTLGEILKKETHEFSNTNPNPWVNASDWNLDENPGDHPDHHATSLALLDVFKRAHNEFNRAWFKTYCTSGLPANLDGPRLIQKRAVYNEYASEAGDEWQEWRDYGPKDSCRTVGFGTSD
jgi:hypothetical protein